MNVRDRIYAALNDPSLTDKLPHADIYEASALPDPFPDAFPKRYGVLRYGEIIPGIMNQQPLDFWVHDLPGSYTWIQDVLRLATPLLVAAIGAVDGGWLSDVRWEGESIDLVDNASRTITRYRTYRLTGSGV